MRWASRLTAANLASFLVAQTTGWLWMPINVISVPPCASALSWKLPLTGFVAVVVSVNVSVIPIGGRGLTVAAARVYPHRSVSMSK
jgi:hypothetical protein